MIVWAIIPVKPLRDSKSRLTDILSADERADLTSHLLSRTLETLNGVSAIQRTLVVSRDPAVLKIARRHGVSTFGESDKQDLNLAITRAAHIAMAQQADAVLIIPADLPFINVEDVEMMTAAMVPSNGQAANGYYYQSRAIIICPDHSNDGTNALLVCPPAGFTFQYGPGSFDRHLAEATRLGMGQRIVHAPGLKFDLDTEEDWATYQAYQAVHAGALTLDN
jgi:2-phospho-L-lactate/phosphoenolpyruvate guanylyltransferase